MIAALYVQRGGCYWDLPGVDAWDIERDARRYAGPWPVVAHPPCERWGRFWFGSPLNANAGKRERFGDDGGCFEAALSSVRAYGGVLEHPATSKAWQTFGIASPNETGWKRADAHGYITRVDQSRYGHKAQKPTWLYGVGCDMLALDWAHEPIPDPDGKTKRGVLALMSRKQLAATPPAFRDLLLAIARSARIEGAA
jgi:hypothetical protein